MNVINYSGLPTWKPVSVDNAHKLKAPLAFSKLYTLVAIELSQLFSVFVQGVPVDEHPGGYFHLEQA